MFAERAYGAAGGSYGGSALPRAATFRFPFLVGCARFVSMQRLVTIVMVVVFVVMAIGSTTVFLQTRAEYEQRKQTERLVKERLRIAQNRLKEQEEMLQRLRNDPEYVSLVIRRRLGYAKPDELVFRFEK